MKSNRFVSFAMEFVFMRQVRWWTVTRKLQQWKFQNPSPHAHRSNVVRSTVELLEVALKVLGAVLKVLQVMRCVLRWWKL